MAKKLNSPARTLATTMSEVAHKGAAAPSTVLVTGASSGIGEALACCFAREGHHLVLVARREDKLRALAKALRAEHGTRIDVLPADLAQRGAAEALCAALRRKRRTIEVLVNNAGVLEQGAFAGMAAARHARVIDLNVAGLTAMLAAFVPPMVERGHGRVLNVASIASFLPLPGYAVYAASKAYVLSLTESLSEELRDTGITVTALCPGITETPMFDHAAKTRPDVARLLSFAIGDVREVAAEGYRACMAGEIIAFPGVLNRATALASRATPKWLLRRIAGIVGRRMH